MAPNRLIGILALAVGLAVGLSALTAWGISTSVVGAAGPVGPAGPAGSAGPQGPAGATGATGATGIPGASGATGAQGSTGVKGSTGTHGLPGATGIPGAAGQDGANGTDGVNGTNGTNGTDGASKRYYYYSTNVYGLADESPAAHHPAALVEGDSISYESTTGYFTVVDAGTYRVTVNISFHLVNDVPLQYIVWVNGNPTIEFDSGYGLNFTVSKDYSYHAGDIIYTTLGGAPDGGAEDQLTIQRIG